MGDQQTRQLLLALQEQSKDILLVLRDVQIGVQSLAANGGAGRAVPTGGANATAGGAVVNPMARATPTGKIKELQDRLQTSNANVAKAVQQLNPETKQSSNFGFYAMILGYIAI